jgi:hypothetical protein
MKYVFLFDCPIHGLEAQAFCFRGFQKENTELWKKYTLIEVPATPDEKK